MPINLLYKRPFEDDDEREESKPKFIYKPCIAELMRTCYCPPCIVLLVAKIEEEPVAPPHEHRTASRLYLIDGEYMIQGIIKEETYPFIESGETVEGSYIMLDKYELRKSPKRNGKGDTAYLAIANFHTVGHCAEYSLDSIMDSDDACSSVADVEEKGVVDEDVKPPPAKKFKLDSDESERSNPIGDGNSEFGEIDEDINFDDLDESLVMMRPSVNGKTESIKDGTEQSGEIINEKTIPDEMASARLDANKENMSPEVNNDSNVGVTNNSSKASSFTSISSSSSLSLSTNIKSSESKITQLNNQSTMFKKPPVFITAGPHNSKERITSTGHTLEFYEHEIIQHYYRCHRRDFPERKIFSMTDKNYDALPTRDLIGPTSSETPLSQTAQMLLASHSLSQAALLAIERGQPLKRIYRPLDVRCLRSLKKTIPQQNLICDVIAIIDWISPTVEHVSVGSKRELKLVDNTTDKKVLLSVFDDPENFTPAVGTIALFRNVRNHKWNGYSLNAYEKDCAGFDWFIPNPDWVDEIRVRVLRNWWVKNRVELRDKLGGVREVFDECPIECKHGHDRDEVNMAIAQKIWDEEGVVRDWPNM